MVGDEVTIERGASQVGLGHERRSPSGAVEDVAREGLPSLTRLRRVGWMLALGDIMSITAALLFVEIFWGRDNGSSSPSGFLAVLLTSPAIWVAVFGSCGLYGWNGLSRPSLFVECRSLVIAAATGVFMIVVVSAWWDVSPTQTRLAALFLTALTLELFTRWLSRVLIRHLRRNGSLSLRTLLVGTNDEARSLRRHLDDQTGWFTTVGSIATSLQGPSFVEIPVVGNVDSLDEAIRQSRAECVFVAATAVSADEVLRISRACRRADVELQMTANVSDVLSSRLSIRSADGVVAIAFRRPSRMQQTIKRCVDLVFGTLLFLLTIPLFLAISAAIRLTSKGPILFRQARVTKDGKVFTIYKFRTMVDDSADALGERLIDLTEPFFKLEDDPRLTKVGRFLRSFSLDELPQLMNVIKGDMSLVGPRPLPAEQVVANEETLRPRHEIRTGLTGLWQISGRSELESADALRMDRFYIENWSLSLDAYILLKTVTTVLTRRGAY